MIHLMRIDEIKHIDKHGNILWEDHDIFNIFHAGGQQFLLSMAFNTASAITPPPNYYLGLDNRATLSLSDTLASIFHEPTTNGYTRQTVNSLVGFAIELESNGNYVAQSGTVTFTAAGGSWGPVQNLFLSTISGNATGYLLSSAILGAARTVNNGESLVGSISVGLFNC